MHKTIMMHVRAVLLLLIFSSINSSEKLWDNTIISHYPLECCLVSVTLMCAAILVHYYYTVTHYDHLIEDCRSCYKVIAQDIQRYQYLYHADAQMSDWDLKAIIIENHRRPYPFMTYYKSLIKNLYRLHTHLATLNKRLKTITIHQNKLRKDKPSEETAHLKEIFFQLKIRGKQLQIRIIETITLIIILKNRLKLFKEYNDDCLNWSQITQRIKSIIS